MKYLMNKLKFAYFLLIAFLPISMMAQNSTAADSTGLPGDGFSLEGALELFKEAKSPEDFEKELNTESNYVNNLDLNEDGTIDYIRVIDHMEGDVHAIVLQVPLSASESQDVAVIEIEKNGPESALLQIVGDEAIFGESLIVEPFDIEGKGGNGGPDGQMELAAVILNVWHWKCVRVIYRPGYVAYASAWTWLHYPNWWRPVPRRPFRVFHPLRVRHHSHYRVVKTHRVVRAHRVYTPRRKSAGVVVSRTTVKRNAVRRPGPAKKTTTKKTTVVGKKGKKGAVVGKKTTRTTTVKRRKRN